MGYNLLINGVYWGYNPLTNHLLTSWDIQVVFSHAIFFHAGPPKISSPRHREGRAGLRAGGRKAGRF